MSRKTKLSHKTIDLICDGIRSGLPKKRAAERAGIHESTLYDWVNRADEGRLFAKFSEALKKAESDLMAYHLDRIKAASDDGTWQASAWILERRFQGEFGRRQKIDHDGKIEGQSPTEPGPGFQALMDSVRAAVHGYEEAEA